jgi:hypothetical protein
MSAGDGVASEETLDLGLPDWMMATRDAALSAGGIIFGADLGYRCLSDGVACHFPCRQRCVSAAWCRGVSTEDIG